jgi:hypothetical protein
VNEVAKVVEGTERIASLVRCRPRFGECPQSAQNARGVRSRTAIARSS